MRRFSFHTEVPTFWMKILSGSIRRNTGFYEHISWRCRYLLTNKDKERLFTATSVKISILCDLEYTREVIVRVPTSSGIWRCGVCLYFSLTFQTKVQTSYATDEGSKKITFVFDLKVLRFTKFNAFRHLADFTLSNLHIHMEHVLGLLKE